MQREDVERLADNLDTFAQNYPGLAKDAANALRTLLAERDAAFAAGLEAAAEAVLYLCRMKGMGNRTIDGPEAAHLIRDLPIKGSPDGR